MPDKTRPVTEPALVEALGQARYAYDRQGEDHYNLISALVNKYHGLGIYIDPVTGVRSLVRC